MIDGYSAAAMNAVVLRRKQRAMMLCERPRIIVIGGQCRGVGKTALATDVIRAFPECDWLAVKITQHHMENSDSAGYVFRAESDRSGNSDTSRYLVAGAARSFLLQVSPGHFGEAMAELRALASGAENVIIESNAALDYVPAALVILVLDPRRADFKTSARRRLGVADAFVVRWPLFEKNWPGIEAGRIHAKPCFLQPIGVPLPISLRRCVRLALGK